MIRVEGGRGSAEKDEDAGRNPPSVGMRIAFPIVRSGSEPGPVNIVVRRKRPRIPRDRVTEEARFLSRHLTNKAHGFRKGVTEDSFLLIYLSESGEACTVSNR